MEIRVGQGFDVHPFVDDPTGRSSSVGSASRAPVRSPVTATPTRWPTPVPMRCSARPASATSASSFPTPIPTGRAPTACVLLAEVRRRVRAEGWQPGNVDCSVVTDEPKLAPHREAMQDRLSAAVGAPVTVKGRRPEGLGALGRGEGVACWAVAVVSRP